MTIEGVGGRDAGGPRPQELIHPVDAGKRIDPEPDVKRGVAPVSDPVSEVVSEVTPDDVEETVLG